VLPRNGIIAFGARGHMPAERLGSAGFNRGHHFELGQADMSFIGLPPSRTMVTENVSDLQLRLGQTSAFYPGRCLRVCTFNFLSASNGLGGSRIVLVATWTCPVFVPLQLLV
jgi:hypothetical protein